MRTGLIVCQHNCGCIGPCKLETQSGWATRIIDPVKYLLNVTREQLFISFERIKGTKVTKAWNEPFYADFEKEPGVIYFAPNGDITKQETWVEVPRGGSITISNY